MKITDLAPELQELVHKRQIEQGNAGIFEEYLDAGQCDDNFDWNKTLEGYDFWSDVNAGNDVKHYMCYPEKINNLFPIY